MVRYLPPLFFAGSLLLATSTAAAPPSPRGNFDDVDADHDGHVTLQEYQAYLTNRLKTADGPMAQRFNQLTPDQQAERLKERFGMLDKSHKGYLDRQDWSAS